MKGLANSFKVASWKRNTYLKSDSRNNLSIWNSYFKSRSFSVVPSLILYSSVNLPWVEPFKS